MIKQLIEYKHSMLNSYDTSKLTEQPSKAFKNNYYIFNNNELVMVSDSTVANDSHELANRLRTGTKATLIELEMLSCE
jgi:hypothetical protein